MTRWLDEKDIGRYLKMSGFIGLFILVYVMAQLFVRAAAEIVYEFRSGAAGGPGLGYRLFFSGLLALPAYFVIPSCRGETFREAAGFRKTEVKKILLSVLLGIGAAVSLIMILNFMPLERWFPDYVELMKKMNESGGLIPRVLGAGIMAPVIEEIIFRGFIFRELGKNVPRNAAILAQGLLFGLYHFNLLQGIYAAILGVLLAYVLVWTGSLWAPIAMHMAVNNTGTFLHVVSGKGLTGYYMLLALALGLTASVFAVNLLRTEYRDEFLMKQDYNNTVFH